jgi:hypothetical protein
VKIPSHDSVSAVSLPEAQAGGDVGKLFDHVTSSTCATMGRRGQRRLMTTALVMEKK